MPGSRCTVIILNWNGKKFLPACLSSLRQQTLRDLDILLVDNASQDDSVAFVTREFPEVRILQLAENLGFCRPNNLAIEDALARGSEFVLLLNNDTIVAPDCLAHLLAAMDDPNVAAVCPKIFFADPPDTLWYAGADFNLWTSRSTYRGWKQKDQGQYDQRQTITQATGCALLVRASAIKEVGLLDERLWAYVEDLDWSLRFLRRGYHLAYEPGAEVWHFDGGTTVGNGSQYRRQYLTTRNLLLLCRDHVRWFQLPTYVLGFLIFHVSFYMALRLARGDFRAIRAIGQGIADSLRAHGTAPDAQSLGLTVPLR